MEQRPFHPALIAAVVGLLLVLLVAACGSSDDPPRPAKVEQYRSYLEESSADLVMMTGRLLAKIEAGERPKAESRYASTRVFYGQVQPAAASFDLDRRIDSLSGEVPADEFGGFHRIEKALADEHTTDGVTPVAKQLLADVEELQRRVKSGNLDAARIAENASTLLDEVSTSTIRGGEEPYMHIDFVDAAARIEGAEAAFKALRPTLVDQDSGLVEEIEAGFAKAYAKVGYWGTLAREPDQPRAQEPGIAFVVHSELSDEVIDETAKPIEALAELFSEVPDQIPDE